MALLPAARQSSPAALVCRLCYSSCVSILLANFGSTALANGATLLGTNDIASMCVTAFRIPVDKADTARMYQCLKGVDGGLEWVDGN